MSNTASELLHTQMNGESANKENYSLITNKEIPNTPFIVTGNQDKGYFLRIGKWKLTDNLPTEEEVEKELKRDNWNIISRLIAIMIEAHKEFSQQ